jgi:AcrR family transcriptional regulator
LLSLVEEVGVDVRSMRSKITEAAIQAVAAEGVSTSTAAMAKRGGLAQGSIFHHYETKAGLLNAVFLQLKEELRVAVIDDLPPAGDDWETLGLVWRRWLRWGTAHAERRRALVTLGRSDVITAESRTSAESGNLLGVDLFQRLAAGGPLAGMPIQFIGALVDAVADATMDAMLRDPGAADAYRDRGLQALRSMLR